MTFLNPALLIGLLASLVPLLIYLLHRRRPRVVRWGAIHLLEASVAQRSRRVQLEQLILLAVRMAIVGLLAFAMARPLVFSLASAGLLGSSRSVVVVLDTSYSVEKAGRRDVALTALRRIADAVREEGDESVRFVLLEAGGPPRVVFEGVGALSLRTDSIGTARTEDGFPATLRSLRMRYSRARLADALRHVLENVEKPGGFEEIFVLEDLQAVNWPSSEREALRTLLNRLRDDRASEIVWVDIGDETASRSGGVSIREMRWDRRPAVVSDEVEFLAVLRNDGNADESVAVSFHVDGQQRDRFELSVGAGANGETRFRFTFDRARQHLVEMRLESGSVEEDGRVEAGTVEDRAVDARWYAVVEVLEALPVLIIEGRSSSELLKSGSGFLQLALGAGRVEVAVREAGDPSPLALDGVRAVVAVDVPALSDGQLDSLDEFVRSGGGLIIVSGPQVAAAHYNRQWFERRGLLAARLGEPRRAAEGAPETLHHPSGGGSLSELHPILRLLDEVAGDLERVRIRQWLSLELAGAPEVTVLARTSSGDPLLVERSHGRGRSILIATAIDDTWSNLPLRSLFVPLLSELIAHAASKDTGQPRNLTAGESLRLELPSAVSAANVRVRSPDGSEASGLPVETSGRWFFEHRDTRQAGFYTVYTADGRTQTFAANPDREESDLERVQTDTVRELTKVSPIVPNELEAYLNRTRLGAELWKPALILCLVLIFAEIFLQQRFEGGAEVQRRPVHNPPPQPIQPPQPVPPPSPKR